MGIHPQPYDPLTITGASSYSNPDWLTSLAASKLTGPFGAATFNGAIANTYAGAYSYLAEYESFIGSKNSSGSNELLVGRSVDDTAYLIGRHISLCYGDNASNVGLRITNTGVTTFNGRVTTLGSLVSTVEAGNNNNLPVGNLDLWSASGSGSCIAFSETGVANRGCLGFQAGSNTLVFKTGATSIANGTTVFSVNAAGTVNAGAADFNGIVSSSTEFRLGGFSFSRVAQLDGAGGWGGGYNFNVNSSTSQRDSTGTVAAIRFDQSSVQLFCESSGSPGAITPRYSFGPTGATFVSPLSINNGSNVGTVFLGPDSYVQGDGSNLTLRHAGSGSAYVDFGTSTIFRRTSDFATMATISNTGVATFNGGVHANTYGFALTNAPLLASLAVLRTPNDYRILDDGNFIINNAGATLVSINSSATTFTSTAKLGDFTVATLPSAASNAGYEANVTDSSVTTFGSTVAGSGSSRVKVYSNGTNWTVQAV